MIALVLSLAMALTSLFVPAGIYAADGTIQVGVPVSGTVSSEVKPLLRYWTDRESMNDPAYQGQDGNDAIGGAYIEETGEWGSYYSEYSLTADATGFYEVDYSEDSSNEMYSSYYILDSDNVIAGPFLRAGENYRIIVYASAEPVDLNFTLTVSFLGDEISGSLFSAVYDSTGNITGVDETRQSWTLNADGLLKVRGMGDLFNEKGSPWNYLENVITEVEVGDGITGIAYMQFFGLSNVEKVTIPSTVTKVEQEAFAACTGLKEIVFNGDAPVFEATTDEMGETWYDIFSGVTATAYYPAGNRTWTEAVRQNYGGNITWVPKELEPGSYYDVSQNAWYHDAVKYAGENNLMSGVGGGNFDPDGEANRAMITTILYRMEGTPQPAGAAAFTDVAAGSYYADAVAWASSENIVSGYSQTSFAPEDQISRQQLATMLYRYAQYKGYDVSDTADLSAFDDSDSIASYAEEAVSWAVAEGLISGTDDTTLSPEGTATRAQIATILMRFCESIAA